eukprot:TRINITY_DN20279_c0_g1_i1.p2 TRINITY_DN20279_c0_g1~~TRINITY_DN20279_c0_g1_i1.p2  ORF type:complete len:242 (+),score=30.17 TRINITY_DN20279_c0_g1_i1:735-1460(+)
MVDFGVYRYVAAAWTGNGEVFLTSREHVEDLLQDFPPAKRERMLDIGAGSGSVTKVWAGFFKEVVATEVAEKLVKDLKKNVENCQAYLSDTAAPQWIGGNENFDLVLCLNVLDRCASITKLLDEAIQAVAPGGRLVVGLPLPLRQAQHRLGAAQELLWPPHTTQPCAFEHSVAWFSGYILNRYSGSELKLTRIVRCPYLSKGPAKAPLSVLDTAIFVFDKPMTTSRVRKNWVDFSREPSIV